MDSGMYVVFRIYRITIPIYMYKFLFWKLRHQVTHFHESGCKQILCSTSNS